MDPAEVVYNKALTYAKWAYIGILFPAAGVALSIVAKNLLQELNPKDEDTMEMVKSARKTARLAFWASFWWLWVILPIWIVSSIIAAAMSY